MNSIKRLIHVLCCWLLLCAPAWAAGEFQLLDKSLSGQTLYVLLFSGPGEADAGEAWDGDSWEPLTDTWANFDVAMTETTPGTSGLWLGTMPAIGNKNIRWTIYQDANDDATPSSTADIPLADGNGYWATSVFGVFLTSDMTAANFVAELISAEGTISPLRIASDHIWQFNNRNTITASNTITEAVGSDNVKLTMDFSGTIPQLASIEGIASVTVADISGETEPTITSSAKTTDQKKVDIIFSAASATDATYTVSVAITTTDSQTFVRRGRLALQ